MNLTIIIGIVLIGIGTVLIQKGRTTLAFKNTEKIITHINKTDSSDRTKIVNGMNLQTDEIVSVFESKTNESKLEIMKKLSDGFDHIQKGTNNIENILTGGNTFPFLSIGYRPKSNQLQFTLKEKGKHKLPNKLIEVYNLSINRDREMLNVSTPAKQYLIEKTNEYLEFYIEGSTTGKLNSWLFEVLTKKEDFVYLLVRTTSDNGITRQIYYIDNFRDDNFFMDSFSHVEGISGMLKDTVLLNSSDKGIKLFENGKPIPDEFIPPFGLINTQIKRDWKNRVDVHIPDGWSKK